MSENMRDMTLNLIVNSQVGKLKTFNQELKRTQNDITKTENKVGWLGKTFRRVFGAYLGIQGVKSLVSAYRNIDLIRRSIEGLTKSTQDWQYIQKEALKTGTDIEVVAKGYRNFYSAANMAGFDKGGIQQMYSEVLVASRAIGATQQQTSGALLALEQMLSKGKVSMEELRRQLGNALPGAFEIGAKAMGVTTQKFNEMVKAGLQANEFVPKFTKELLKTYETAFPEATKSLDFALVNLHSTWKLFQYDLMQNSDAGKELAKVITKLTKVLQSPQLKGTIESLAKVLNIVFGILGYLIQNLETILFLLAPVALGGALTKILGILKSVVAWITAGNLALTTTQKTLFKLFLMLALLQELVAFFTPMDGALETALLGKDQSWMTRLANLVGFLIPFLGVLGAGGFLGKKMGGGLGKMFGVGATSKGATNVVSEAKTIKSPILDAQGRNIVRNVGGKTLAKQGGKYLAASQFPALGEALAAMMLVGDLSAISARSASNIGINPMTITPSGFALPYGASGQYQLAKTETIAPNITYSPSYKIDATTMTPEQLKAILDERDRNFWTKLINPANYIKPKFSLGGK